MGQHRLRIFLEVVGRKHMIFRGHKLLEKTPGAARAQPQRLRVGGRDRVGALRSVAEDWPIARSPATVSTELRMEPRATRPRSRANTTRTAARSAQRDAAGHPAVKSAEIETSRQLCLRGGHPFEQSSMTHEQAIERSYDRVGHQPRLMREKSEQHRDLRRSPTARSAPTARKWLRLEIPSRRGTIPVMNGSIGGSRDRRDDEAGPYQGEAERGSVHPAINASNAAGADNVRRRLSIIFQRPRIGIAERRSPTLVATAIAAGVRAAKNPREQLPVAARPSMLPGGGNVVTRRKFLHHLDVGGQSRAREDSLEQIVTQKRVVGNAPSQCRLEDVDIVDSLAAVRAFAEQILIHVGDRERVRVDAARAREHALENRSLAPGRQRRA